MKKFLLPVLLLPLSSDARQETIGFQLEEENAFLRTFESVAESQLDRISYAIDGEVVNETDDVDFTVESLERVIVRDEIIEVEDGRPTDFRRTFVELIQESTQTIGEDDVELESGSDLEGVTIRFLWDDDDEAFYAELDDDDDDVDEDTLEWLRADMDLFGMLPDDDVEEGDSWEIDASAYLPLMWPGGLVDYFENEAEGYDEFEQAMNRAVIENLEGEGTVTFEETRDEDGTRVAVLSVELAVESSVELEREEEEGGDVTIELEIERDIEGEVLWDLDNGHLYSAHFEADSEWDRTESRDVEHDGTDYELSQTFHFSGNVTYDVEIERE